MRKFNLDNYETVKQRKARFYKDYKDGRIIVKNITPENELMNYALFEVNIYKNKEEQAEKLVYATGYAMEIRDTELKTSRNGDKYESVNFTSWTENCEESAVGRALDNAGYSSNEKCSREEIVKSETMKKTLTKEDKFVKDLNQDLINDITNKVKELNPDIKKEEFKSFIKEKTGEELEIKNLNNIINKLDILISEKK
jgi:hypothetical protein